MRRQPLAFAALLAGVVLGSVGQAQVPNPEEEAVAYPKAGAYIPGPFHVVNLTGDRRERYHCLVCQFSTLPVIGLLVRLRNEKDEDDWIKQMDPDQPFGQLVKGIGRHLAKNPDGNMLGFVVFYGPKDDQVAVLSRLDDPKEKKALLFEQNQKNMIFAFDDKGSSYKYFADIQQGKDLPTKQLIRVLMYNKYKLVYDVRDFTKDKPLTEKDVNELLSDLVKMTPPPVVNRKKYNPNP